MRSNTIAGTAIALAILVMPLKATAHEYTIGTIKIDHPWARVTPPAAPVAGGYITITNSGTEPDRLVSGSSSISQKFEIHESKVVDGVASMRPVVGGVEIAPGATVALKSGGAHIMFIKPAKRFVEGEKFPATLIFEKAGPVTVDFAIQGMGASAPPENHGGHGSMPQ
ncbi:copper chaperone PCu(A)C [Aminobacter anthyllidis]|uniref:Copper chaperone PCu(A)C n=1 Tax=Aminobacter anthyllidis TaxID=1035067 RepID=A0A9X1A9Z1_9HYPH|nr:copper chaperone PCu(A)C [Aminobacter anthyllidis]MBT1155863.1 copper chaperone PCu(A)C [Aminobacter anthyllidis]